MRTLTMLCLALAAAPAARAQDAVPPAPGGPTAPAPSAPPAASAAPAEVPAASPAQAIGFGEAIQRAALHATFAGLAAEEVRRADALLTEARSASLPLLFANGTYTRFDSGRTLTPGTTAINQRGGSVVLTVPLFAPSRWYQWAHAADQVAVARSSEQDVRRTVTLTAARAYLSIVSLKRAVDVSRRAVETSRAHFDFARTRRAGGVGNALDEARADQQLATSETQLENALTALARAQEALGVATGSDGALDAREDPDLGAAPATPEEALRQAETARADVRAARDRADAAHRVTRDSWADWLPTLAATGQTFVNRPSSTVSPYDGWQAQLVLSFPIFEGFLRVGQERERGALEAEARTQLEGLTLQARSDVRTALATLQHAQAALAQSRRGAERAHTALILVGGAYRAGATTSLDVVDAEQRARDADTAAVVAEDAVRQARLDLLAATGRFP